MPQKPLHKYAQWPLTFLILGTTWAFIVGGWQLALTVFVLSMLEISLSFDNAVVNAHVLKNWDETWRKLFLGVGIIIAVFGMRLVFPVLIVCAVASLSPSDALTLALLQPEKYAEIMHSSHALVAGFGGAFLAMVGLTYFLDDSKDVHWWEAIEARLTKLGQIEAISVAIVLAMLVGTAQFLPDADRLGFIVSGALGLMTFVLTKAVGTMLGGGDVGSKIIKQGIGGFLYLELLDASFSFDGVIGAFAITNQLIWIMVGLGIGAFAVRELTVLAVDRGTLTEFRYLEHGAFWAIIALAGLMFVGAVTPIPEVVTGLLGAALIGLSLWSSVRANQKDNSSAAQVQT